ncbi:S24 family peptidase [Xanthobacter flavus]|uniref:S24 family peptidase n=1 Tax=Xanthobacter flavus TaxID=281 RepID=UPI00372712F0
MNAYKRIIERLKEVHPDWTERKASLEATGGRNPDLFRAIKRGRSSFPRGANLQGLADVLQVPTSWLTSLTPAREVEPDFPPDLDHAEKLPADEPMTVGSETGRRNIPDDASAQLDVTAGMGGGGLTIVSEGVPGRAGMTFAAEHVRDFWRLPTEVLAALGLRARDVIVVPVQGDSMSSTLAEGDFVFVDTRHRLPSPDGIYCLTDDFGGLVVKRLEVVSRPRDEEVQVRIISDNPKHEPKTRHLSEIQIIGRVLRRFGVVG